jgi:hypothetical protein
MRARELFLQSCFFTISCLTLLFLLSIAVHFPSGRVLFAVLVSVICLSAECFALFKVAQSLWRWSGKAVLAILRIAHSGQPSRSFD